jgi:hypothetical protein
MTTSPDKYIDYCMSIAHEFQARLDRLRVFVANHNLSSGTANESILRQFLSLHAPSDINVGEGFICDPFEGEETSKQCDILIYDQANYPLVYGDGPIKVVFPGAARMVVEVKTTLNRTTLGQAIENIVSAQRVCASNYYFQGVIFAFNTSVRLGTMLDNLKKHPRPTYAPRAILLFDKGILIHRHSFLRLRESGTVELDAWGKPQSPLYPYAVRRAKADNKEERHAAIVTFLLLVYFEAIRARGLLESTAINAIVEAMEEHTELLDDQLYIGAPVTEDWPDRVQSLEKMAP